MNRHSQLASHRLSSYVYSLLQHLASSRKKEEGRRSNSGVYLKGEEDGETRRVEFSGALNYKSASRERRVGEKEKGESRGGTRCHRNFSFTSCLSALFHSLYIIFFTLGAFALFHFGTARLDACWIFWTSRELAKYDFACSAEFFFIMLIESLRKLARFYMLVAKSISFACRKHSQLQYCARWAFFDRLLIHKITRS